MRMHRVLSMWMFGCLALAAGCSSTRSVLGVSAAPAPAPAETAGSLDELLVSSWLKAEVKIAPSASDPEFLRRVSLDLIGRVPTLPETRAFLADRGPDRRLRLVDRLLASPELAEHFADLYSDLLWRNEGGKRPRQVDRQDPRAWLVTAFNENRPYDQIVHDLLTASGDVGENGAAAFIAARARGGGGPRAGPPACSWDCRSSAPSATITPTIGAGSRRTSTASSPTSPARASAATGT
jgi:hypothetical protein